MMAYQCPTCLADLNPCDLADKINPPGDAPNRIEGRVCDGHPETGERHHFRVDPGGELTPVTDA